MVSVTCETCKAQATQGRAAGAGTRLHGFALGALLLVGVHDVRLQKHARRQPTPLGLLSPTLRTAGRAGTPLGAARGGRRNAAQRIFCAQPPGRSIGCEGSRRCRQRCSRRSVAAYHVPTLAVLLLRLALILLDQALVHAPLRRAAGVSLRSTRRQRRARSRAPSETEFGRRWCSCPRRRGR